MFKTSWKHAKVSVDFEDYFFTTLVTHISWKAEQFCLILSNLIFVPGCRRKNTCIPYQLVTNLVSKWMSILLNQVIAV